jgi:glycolate oxidase FAD binding subunit
VFPKPASHLTLTLDVSDPESLVKVLTTAANSRWELDALDGLPDGKSIALRLGGPANALPSLAQEILGRWPGRVLSAEDANALWLELRECRWVNAAMPLVKIAVSPSGVVALAQSVSALSGARMHLSAGGNVAFVSLATANQVASLDESLRSQKLSGVTLRGDAPLWLGARTHFKIAQAVKAALDAENRFPGLDD